MQNSVKVMEEKAAEFCQKTEQKKVMQWVNGGENIRKLVNHSRMSNSNKRITGRENYGNR